MESDSNDEEAHQKYMLDLMEDEFTKYLQTEKEKVTFIVELTSNQLGRNPVRGPITKFVTKAQIDWLIIVECLD